MDVPTAETRALDAAEDLFYRRGVHSVGMDDIRDTSGVSLKRLYQLFPNKEQLVTSYLRRRDRRWRAGLAEHVGRVEDPRERLLSVFDWLHTWFTDPDFRGCAWINCFGELSATSPAVAEETRAHKDGFRLLLRDLAAAAGRDDELAEQLLLLADGAIVTAAITGDPAAAHRARAAADTLIG
jgi:AcrR family transcriptional regulator